MLFSLLFAFRMGQGQNLESTPRLNKLAGELELSPIHKRRETRENAERSLPKPCLIKIAKLLLQQWMTKWVEADSSNILWDYTPWENLNGKGQHPWRMMMLAYNMVKFRCDMKAKAERERSSFQGAPNRVQSSTCIPLVWWWFGPLLLLRDSPHYLPAIRPISSFYMRLLVLAFLIVVFIILTNAGTQIC